MVIELCSVNSEAWHPTVFVQNSPKLSHSYKYYPFNIFTDYLEVYSQIWYKQL